METGADERGDNESYKFGGTSPNNIFIKTSLFDSNGNSISSPGLSKSYEDTNFVTGDSPVTIDANADLERNATDGYISNDGAGDILVKFSNDGTNFGDQHTIKSGEEIGLKNLNIDKIILTWISDSSYRIFIL